MSSPREETINAAKALFDKVGFNVFYSNKVHPYSHEDVINIQRFNLLTATGQTGRFKFKKSPYEIKSQIF